jgi:cell division protein FtsW
VQAFFNISVVLSLVPTKGIPLPFISYGGSSLVPTLVAVGVLLNISQYAGTTGEAEMIRRGGAAAGAKKREPARALAGSSPRLRVPVSLS